MSRFYFLLLLLTTLLFSVIAKAEITPSLPETIDPDRHYLIYLHGAIVEGSDGKPMHPDLGVYKYHEIVDRLYKEGFWVISEIRRKNTDTEAYAGLISFYVDQLKKSRCPFIPYNRPRRQ